MRLHIAFVRASALRKNPRSKKQKLDASKRMRLPIVSPRKLFDPPQHKRALHVKRACVTSRFINRNPHAPFYAEGRSREQALFRQNGFRRHFGCTEGSPFFSVPGRGTDPLGFFAGAELQREGAGSAKSSATRSQIAAAFYDSAIAASDDEADDAERDAPVPSALRWHRQSASASAARHLAARSRVPPSASRGNRRPP